MKEFIIITDGGVFGMNIWAGIGRRYTLEQLPPITKEVYGHISRIWGIPVVQLLPFRARLKKTIGRISAYEEKMHVIAHASAKVEELEHEGLHSIDYLIGPSRQRLRSRLLKPFDVSGPREARADFFHRRTKAGVISNAVAAALFYSLFSGTPVVPFSAAFQPKRMERLRQVYSRHGVSGLLLLYAHPPIDPINILRREKQWIAKGYLQGEGGGLTEDGEDFLRNTIPRNEIIGRLNFAEAKRTRFQNRTKIRRVIDYLRP